MAGIQFILYIFPISVILLLLGLFTKKKIFGIALIGMWCALILMFLLAAVLNPFNTKKSLDQSDFYGEYIIDRNYFKGEHADWQYNSFRFEIKKNNSIYFYVTDCEIINETYIGTIATVTPYNSARLVLEMEKPNHHILTTNPTIYREIWDFHMVFNSPKFNNMYFRKGEWKEIE